MKYTNTLETIGNTPLVELKKFSSSQVKIFAKLEGQNPSGSIKDRVALHMIETAEKNGELTKDKTILEATSGNMGIALSMIGAYKGYEVNIVMSEAMSEERKKIMRGFGAKLIGTPKELGTAGAIQKVQEFLTENPAKFWFANQFNNPANTEAHYLGTAPEILQDLPKVDYIVAGGGTFGTITGIAKKFREISPQTKIIGLLPEAGYKIQGIQNFKKDFHGDLLQTDLVDEFVEVSQREAFETTRELAKKEGIFAGMSSGANLFSALKLREKIKEGNVVVIFPDRGEKYLSTPLFE